LSDPRSADRVSPEASAVAQGFGEARERKQVEKSK